MKKALENSLESDFKITSSIDESIKNVDNMIKKYS